MEKPQVVEVQCHPEASRSTQEFVSNFNWALKNYSNIVKKVGSPGYAAVYGHKMVDSDKDRMELVKRLDIRFTSEDYESICIVSV